MLPNLFCKYIESIPLLRVMFFSSTFLYHRVSTSVLTSLIARLNIPIDNKPFISFAMHKVVDACAYECNKLIVFYIFNITRH